MTYKFETPAGLARIIQRGKYFYSSFADEELGNYMTPEEAAEELSAGDFPDLMADVNIAGLQIPEDLMEWEMAR
jgi:hypothetical protein